MPDKDFLESYPLYKKLEKYVGYSFSQVAKPSINMFCVECESEQTFNMAGEYRPAPKGVDPEVSDVVLAVTYICRGCHNSTYHFLLRFEGNKAVWKVGQYPPWSIGIPKALASALGAHEPEYKKGLISESQGYGIGAFAYYRRIVEENIDSLLSEIEGIVPDADKERYRAALAEVRKTRVTQEKIALAKDVLPESLRPDGLNPLAVLHDVLSEGLHVESDERCLQLAGSVREVLVFLTGQVLIAKARSKSFTDNMRKLLERNAEAPS